MITADAGGSNGYRVRAWKWHLARLAADTGLEITVLPLPARHVEVEQDRTPPVQLHLDELARPAPHRHRAPSSSSSPPPPPQTGLTVQRAYDPNWYPTGERITDADYNSIPLTRHDWHGDWNYTIAQSIPR